jgi:hypothetical protein
MREQLIWIDKDTGQEQSGQAARLSRTLVSRILMYVAQNQPRSLTRVRAHLLELIDAKPSLGRAQNLRSAHALLGRYGDLFNRALNKALADGLAEQVALALPSPAGKSVPGRLTGHAMDGMSLSLIDIEEVERILLLDRVALRFALRYEVQLEALTQRLGVLFGRETSSARDNPFGPLVFVNAFRSAWEQCKLDPLATEDLILSLEPAHWLDLAPLYGELNAALVIAGVPAQRAMAIKRSTDSGFTPLDSRAQTLGGSEGAAMTSKPAPLGAAGNARSGNAAADAPSRSAWGALAPVGRNVAAQARQFLQRLGLTPGHQAKVGDEDRDQAGRARPVFEDADPALMGYLGGLQAGAGAGASNQWFEGHDPAQSNVLRQMRNHDEIRRAPELDRGTVDALAEVFDFVFADQAIPAQMKVIIGRLQIPVLKAAMIDRDFFLSDQHPARRLVDTLAGASITWAPDKGDSDPLYIRIEATVQRVLTEFEDDLNLFVDLLRDFTEFLFESEQQVQARVEPVAAIEHKRENQEQALVQADELVHECIRAYSSDQALAPFLLPFLTVQWRNVVAHWLLRGDDPVQVCAQARKTMAQLIWSTQPKINSEQRRELVVILPELVRQLNLGLDAIEWDGTARATFTRRLITTHTMAIRMRQPADLDTAAAELEASNGRAAMQQLEERRAAQVVVVEDAFDTQVHSLKRGMWFDVEVAPGTHVHCRLSWVSPMRTRLLFTNRDGFDAFVRSEREAAAMLRLGRMRVLEQEAIVGRALDQIMVGQDLLAA